MENLDNDVRDEVVPFYFGILPKKLYGCHHLPQVSREKALAVVLCSAIGQEYLQSHRTIYQLAVLLSKVGFHVLRFDYLGCGDSEGDFEQGSLVQWTKNIHAAVEEMQNRSGKTQVCLIGLRMGATLALQAAAGCHSISAIVLWEPVFNGNLYLKELVDAQLDFSNRWRHKIKRVKRSEMKEPDEILGFPITSGLRQELKMINLDRLKLRSGVRLLVLSDGGEDPSCVSDVNRFIWSHPHADIQAIADQPKVWKEFYKRLTPHKTLQYLVKWVDTVQS